MKKFDNNANNLRHSSFYQRYTKRFIDVIFSAFALILLSPIMMIIAIVL